MKRMINIIVLSMFCINLYSQLTKELTYNAKKYKINNNKIGIKYKGNYNTSELKNILKEYNFTLIKHLEKKNLILIEIPREKLNEEITNSLKRLTIIDSLVTYDLVRPCVTPNDTYYSGSQYSLQKINAAAAWDLTTGSSSVIIGVLDTGIPFLSNSLTHPDLQNSNRIIVGNNYSSDIRGMKDSSSHGTHVAGIAGAETNNSLGISGVGWNSKLYINKVMTFDSIAWGDSYWISAGIVNAVQNGVKIINLSLGAPSDGFGILESAVQYANNNNVLIVAASGNHNPNENPEVVYPAKYAGTYSNVICVAATDRYDAIASFSNYGTEVSVAAPGVGVYSTIPNYVNASGLQNYTSFNGTSMATPIVSGIAGLLLAKMPNITPELIKKTIEYSADDLGATGYDNYYGYGRVNAYKAVKYLYVPQVYSTLSTALNYATSGQNIVLASGTYTGATIPSGITLQINSGTSVSFTGSLTINGALTSSSSTLTFSSGTGLTVNGSAICEYTTLTGSGWNGIIFNSSNVSFMSNTISNASTGATVNSSLNYFQYNNIYYCETGVTYNNSTTLTLFRNNRIYSNTYGIKYTGNSSGLFFPLNRIADNSNNITISSGSSPSFGQAADQGHNSICNADYFDINSSYSGTISAQYNWWGVPYGTPAYLGTVDYYGSLADDPNPMIGIITESHETAPIMLKKANIKDDNSDGIKEFDAARGLISQNKKVEAESALHEVLNKYPAKLSGRLSLITLNQFLKNEKRNIERSSLLDEIKSETKDMNLLSLSSHIKAKNYIEEDKTELAAKELEEIINTNSGFENMPFVLYDLATISYFKLDNKTVGEKYYNELIAKYPDEEITKSALTILGKSKPNEKYQETTAKNITINNTKLLGNYPNPFNPSTVIKYDILENMPVRLTVYDVLGREVKTLINEVQPKGSYQVKFNGYGLSSGLYFYQLKAGNTNQIKKMVLTK